MKPIQYIVILFRIGISLSVDTSFDTERHVITSGGLDQRMFHTNTQSDDGDLDLIDMRVPLDHVYKELMGNPMIVDHSRENENYLDLIDVGDGWREWSSWSLCSKSCGVGLSQRTRTCIKR